jgi:hypothetical protein
MTNPLSMDFIKALVKKQEYKEVGHKPIFTTEELKLIKTTIKAGQQTLRMRDKNFKIRYFMWKKTEWVTLKPVMGFVPMFSSPKADVLKADIL